MFDLGIRVTAQEVQEGRAWNEARIKQATGGDPITARYMRQDNFTFNPTSKLAIAGNHKPNLKSVDDAMRRRVSIIPFINKPAAHDKQLTEKLQAEWPGILRWAIDGCLLWQKHGLNPPAVVLDATATYFDEQNTFQQWIDECCEVGPSKCDTLANLFRSWKVFAEQNGDQPGNAKTFSPMLIKAGDGSFVSVKDTPGQRGKRGFKGIHVEPVDTSNQYQNQHDR